VGSNPTAALVLSVPLTVIRFIGEQIKEIPMNKKLKKSKSKARATKRRMSKLMSIIVICPLLSGPKLMIFWTTKEI